MKKKLVSVVMAGLLSVSAVAALAGCGESKGENELWITYFSGGYGDEWVKQLGDKFGEREGVKVKVVGDSQLINAVPNMMKNGTKYDLIFCHDIAWEDFVPVETIYCLDDLYATPVDSINSDGTPAGTFAGRIWDQTVLDSCTYPGKDGKDHYYKVPWTIGTAGIAYSLTIMDRVDDYLKNNATYLTSTGRDASFKWDRTPPQTYYELWQYCEDIVKANLSVNPNSTKSAKIVPFTWSGASEEWLWDYVVFDWWGQLAGPDAVDVFKNFGNVIKTENGVNVIDWDNYKKPSSDVYDPSKKAAENNGVGWAELKEAYTLWYNLVVGNTSWSDKNISSYSKFTNEQAFAEKKAAMMPAACWVEYEAKTFLEKSDNEIAIMPTPTIEHVQMNGDTVLKKGETGSYELDAIHGEPGAPKTLTTKDNNTYNRVSFTSSFGDSAMIPQKATQKDLAVKFLLFMQEEENAQLFTRVSGGTVLPYQYKYWESFSAVNQTPTKWQESIFEIDRNSTKFNNYTKHPMMRSTNLKGSAKMTTVWPSNNYYYLKAWQAPTNNTYKPTTLFNTIYSDVQKGWKNNLDRL